MFGKFFGFCFASLRSIDGRLDKPQQMKECCDKWRLCHYYFHFRDFSLLEEYYLFVIVNDIYYCVNMHK